MAHSPFLQIDDGDLGRFTNVLGLVIFVLLITYHYVVADTQAQRTPHQKKD